MLRLTWVGPARAGLLGVPGCELANNITGANEWFVPPVPPSLNYYGEQMSRYFALSVISSSFPSSSVIRSTRARPVVASAGHSSSCEYADWSQTCSASILDESVRIMRSVAVVDRT